MTRFITASLMLFMFFAVTPAQAGDMDDIKIGYGVSVDAVSRFLWRGVPLSTSWVLQPSAYISSFGVTGAFFLNYDGDTSKVNEYDFILEYSYSIKGLSIRPSFVYYKLTEVNPFAEVGVDLSYSLGRASLFTGQYVNVVDNVGGYYGDFGVRMGVRVIKMIYIGAAIRIGWGSGTFNKYFNGTSTMSLNIAQADLSISLRPFSTSSPAKALRGLYFKPFLSICALLDEDQQKLQDRSSYFFGGIRVGIDF